MKWLDGRDLVGFIQQRHASSVRGIGRPLRLVIVAISPDEATKRYLRAKERYGHDIGVEVELITETVDGVLGRIAILNADPEITGIIAQLPLPEAQLNERVPASIAPEKDVDGLAPDSPFQPATAKGILWLLAGYNIDLVGKRIAVVGQGRLVGRPLANTLEASGFDVVRCNTKTTNLAKTLLEADIIVAATGQAGLVTAAMLKPGAVVVDAGTPVSELADDVRARSDLTLTPNPGGVGPMTVAALFDNLIIAAETR